MGDLRADPGSIVWTDLTVPEAQLVSEFYSRVVGWSARPVDMGGYSDFNMHSSEGGGPAAGICHTRGANSDMPAIWMVYIAVDDLDRSLEESSRLGGELLLDRRQPDGSGFCVIRDPAGAVAALYQAHQAPTR